MDLSFTPFDRDNELVALPGDLAAMLIGVAERQTASPTATAQARWSAAADPLLFRPLHGAFNGPMAAVVLRWRKDEADVHQGASTDLQAGGLSPADVDGGGPGPRRVT